MKGLLLGVVFLGGAAVLAGCPIYPSGNSFDSCERSGCGNGYTCDSYGECVPVNYDATDSSVGECGYCPPGTTCGLADGVLQCLSYTIGTPDAAAGEDSGRAPSSDASADAGPTTDAGDSGSVGRLCNTDTQCGGAGARCVDGLCAPQGQLCSDGSQCLVAGDACVDGICIPRCAGSADACGPSGYQCDFNLGVCSINPAVCAQSADCQGGAVCVESRCVAPCATADAGPQCASGQVCVNGGCIFDQQAHFTCQNDGSSGTLASTCDPSSICLHGDCYPSCGADGGACGAGTSCQQVTIPKGTFAVCTTANSLGSQCDPAVGNYCDVGHVCLDGYCK